MPKDISKKSNNLNTSGQHIKAHNISELREKIRHLRITQYRNGEKLHVQVNTVLGKADLDQIMQLIAYYTQTRELGVRIDELQELMHFKKGESVTTQTVSDKVAKRLFELKEGKHD